MRHQSGGQVVCGDLVIGITLAEYKAGLVKYPLLDDFGTFKWPKVSDLKELVVGSRARQ